MDRCPARWTAGFRDGRGDKTKEAATKDKDRARPPATLLHPGRLTDLTLTYSYMAAARWDELSSQLHAIGVVHAYLPPPHDSDSRSGVLCAEVVSNDLV